MDMIHRMLGWMPQLLGGAKITVLLTLCSVSAGLVLSIFLALGSMSKVKIVRALRLVILPQSVRRLIPPVGNEFIMMLKDASLVSLIALADITKVTRSIQSSTASSLVYIPAMVLYLVITAVFSLIFHLLEKKHSVYE